MKKLTAAIFAIVFASSAFAGTAYFKYERTSGMNKICFYDHLGSEVAINVKSYDLCPVSIKV
jgi:hypothetical protein